MSQDPITAYVNNMIDGQDVDGTTEAWKRLARKYGTNTDEPVGFMDYINEMKS